MRTRLSIMILAAVIVALQSAEALPRFASRTGNTCQSCHVNPSGGGMRRTLGVQYGREELTVPTWSQELGIEEFTNKLSETVSIGADMRTLYYYLQTPDTGGAVDNNRNGFWQMQGDVYLNLNLAKKVQVYLDKGLYSGFEIFGLLSILPANGSVKVGKFVPNYGLHLDDHRAFVRQYTGFSPEFGRPELTGGEVMVSPGPVSVTGGIFNAVDGFGSGTGNQKAILGRAEAMLKPWEETSVGFGGSVFTAKAATGVRTTLAGGFAMVSHGDLTVLGEADVIMRGPSGARTDGLVLTTEADYMVTQGLDLKFGYDFYDPDVDLKSGSVSRYSFGLEFFPISGVELRPVYRIVKDDPEDIKNDEFEFLIHFYF